MSKRIARIRRATKTRKKLCNLGVVKLVVHRTSKHIYAQIIATQSGDVLVSASTVEKSIFDTSQITGNRNSAIIIGKLIAERSIKKGIIDVSFDRSGFKYHGRVQELADAARQAGLKF